VHVGMRGLAIRLKKKRGDRVVRCDTSDNLDEKRGKIKKKGVLDKIDVAV